MEVRVDGSIVSIGANNRQSAISAIAFCGAPGLGTKAISSSR